MASKTHVPEYQWIDGAEWLDRYTMGGYHPVHIGDVVHDRYEVVDKLGYGGWSTVWLAHDGQAEQLVALKVGRADSLPHETEVLRALNVGHQSSPLTNGARAISRLLDEFSLRGPNGTHRCYTAEPALCSLRACSFSRLFPLSVARALAYELTVAVAYLHSRGYAHGGMSNG